MAAPGKAAFLLKKGAKLNSRRTSRKNYTTDFKSLVSDHNEEEEEEK